MAKAIQKRRPKGAGRVRQLPSGRWQARFTGTDDVMRSAPTTFDTKLDAAAWLRAQNDAVDRGVWAPEEKRESGLTLGAYAETWLASRDLTPRTRALYREQLDSLILPALGGVRLDRLTPTTVANWYATLNPKTPTRRAQTYSLLRSICRTAVKFDLIDASPCRIDGGGSTRKNHTTKIATLDELEKMVTAITPRYQAMVLLAAWCGLRFGELAELRRKDLDLDAPVVRVSRGMTRVDGEVVIGAPKSEAGRRAVTIPPHLVPALAEHLDAHVEPEPDALLFPAQHGGHMAPASLYRVWYPAREAAGRPDLRFHDLRHTGATLAAQTGATLADLMHRLGHSTPAAALIYQHAAAGRDRDIAAGMSEFATAGRVKLRAVR
ncbi:MAG: putative prophage phiRv2 integrase [Frankiales bacterium]|nr:putative prophage phiRv2 integrase [Frankiales bacterium]